MTIKASKRSNNDVTFTIALIALVTIFLVLTSCFSQSNTGTTGETTFNQIAEHSSINVSETNINETSSSNVANSSINCSSASNNTDIISLETSNPAKYNQPDLSQLIFSFLENNNQDQRAGSVVILPVNAAEINETSSLDITNSYNNYSSAQLSTGSILSDTLEFVTYTYRGGYSVQQPNSTHFIFSFPDNTDQGQLTGSDALTLNTFTIQRIDFDAAFIAPKISALGFDEMVIFVASNTTNYKGTEFGIRMDLKDGFIYGYIQEPNDNGDVNFQMLKLMPNDGIGHHYTLIMTGSEISFYIDGLEYGTLNFPSTTDYSRLLYSILAVVHRFTDDWDSSGTSMIVEDFCINQQ